MRLIGLRCKHGDMFSLQVLIGRGLDLLYVCFTMLYSVFRVLSLEEVGVNSCEVPPVPIPNTEVKPLRAEGTWLVTARESRAMPAQRSRAFYSFVLFLHSSVGRAHDC